MEKRKDLFMSRGTSSRRWTIEIMSGAIYAIKKAGEPVNSNSILRNHPGLHSRISDYPGGWKRVVEEAGLDPATETKARKLRDKHNHGLKWKSE